MSEDGNIPVLFVRGTTLPEGWEKSVLAVWEQGGSYPTEYDQEGEPPSLDATMTLVIDRPFEEPRLHRAFPACPPLPAALRTAPTNPLGSEGFPRAIPLPAHPEAPARV